MTETRNPRIAGPNFDAPDCMAVDEVCVKCDSAIGGRHALDCEVRLRAIQATCHHAKVYSGEMHPTHSPLWFWVCTRCGADGTEHLDEDPPRDPVTFWNTFVTFGRATREEADRMIAMQTRRKQTKMLGGNS